MLKWGRIGAIRLSERITVRRVGFGGAWLTGPGTYGPPPDLDAARRNVRRAVDAGVQLVDTADCYGPETSERLIAESLYPYPDGVVVSTKGGRLPLGNGRWRADGRPEHLREACEGSLRRLRLDAIDLYQLNAVDPRPRREGGIGAPARSFRARGEHSSGHARLASRPLPGDGPASGHIGPGELRPGSRCASARADRRGDRVSELGDQLAAAASTPAA